MSLNIDALNKNEKEFVKGVLINLRNSLEQKRKLGSDAGLMKDESTVLAALKYPERGDVEVILIRIQNDLEIFISNRREVDSPFSVMDQQTAVKHTERRLLDNQGSLPKGQFGLFLLGFQDREMLKSHSETQIKIFSNHFNIAVTTDSHKDSYIDLKFKKIHECSADEKLTILNSNAPADNRVTIIEKEFYQLTIQFPKYKQNATNIEIILLPESYKNKIGQLIRDAYPYGIRLTLRNDFPKDHKKNLNQVFVYIKGILDQIKGLNKETYPKPITEHWQEVTSFLNNILTNDTDLSHFV